MEKKDQHKSWRTHQYEEICDLRYLYDLGCGGCRYHGFRECPDYGTPDMPSFHNHFGGTMGEEDDII